MEISMEPKGREAIERRIQEIRARTGLDALDRSQSFDSVLKGKLGQNDPELLPFDPANGVLVGQIGKSELRSIARDAALSHGVDPNLFDSLVEAESGYNPLSVSSKGAKGLTQLMGSTAQELGVQNVFDPRQNLNGGAKYLRQLLDEFHGDEHLAVAAYNAGPGAVARAGGIPNNSETPKYVSTVMRKTMAKRGA